MHVVKEIINESCLFTYIDARSLVDMQEDSKCFYWIIKSLF